MKNLFQMGKIGAKLPLLAILFVLFFSITSEASAQSYVGTAEATVKLKDQTVVLTEDMATLKVSAAEYNTTQATLNYYTAIINELMSGKSVESSIGTAVYGICYTSSVADCNPLSKTETANVVSDTKAFLSN